MLAPELLVSTKDEDEEEESIPEWMSRPDTRPTCAACGYPLVPVTTQTQGPPDYSYCTNQSCVKAPLKFS